MSPEQKRTTKTEPEAPPMAKPNLESRVANLESELDALKSRFDQDLPITPWWKQISGAFKDDPIFEEAMRLGREYRESLRPKSRARRR